MHTRETATITGRVLRRRALLAAAGGLVVAACFGGMPPVAAQTPPLSGPRDGQLTYPPTDTPEARAVVQAVVP